MTRVSNPVKIQDIKDECARRILNKYPFSVQANLQRAGTPEQIQQMGLFIDTMRTCSNELERMEPIPHDFKADYHWVVPATVPVEEVHTND